MQNIVQYKDMYSTYLNSFSLLFIYYHLVVSYKVCILYPKGDDIS